jgi:hypothetical protein
METLSDTPFDLQAHSLSPSAAKMMSRVNHPLLFAGWSLMKLPSALFAGVRLVSLAPDRCVTAVPYGWRSQNPFRSTYFAAQAMAAELSTGALGLLAVEDAGVPISLLIVGMQGTFGKKAVSTATFTCEQGATVFQAVAEAKATGKAQTFVLETVGKMADGQEVSRFSFNWSVKAKRTG